jgi:hypothetical protein
VGVASEVPPAIQDNFRLLRVRFRGYFRLRLGIFPVVSTVIVWDLLGDLGVLDSAGKCF